MTTENNYDNMLKQLELEIDNLQAHFKSEEKRIFTEIGNLVGTQKPPLSESDMKTARGPEKAEEKIGDRLVEDIDKQLGGFYGSIELRDALKESQKRMDAVVEVLNRVKEYVRCHFVRLEIAHLLQNIETLRKVFLRMLDRMEIPDSDDFFNDSFSESLTAISNGGSFNDDKPNKPKQKEEKQASATATAVEQKSAEK
ncbi:unnamed protein product [Cylicocyclus nassatus]|uniref:Uncharacterized protein n=1 Tax=Cylicocyclus nassatus TaxID=53992 RepID=A0AA36GGA8_CYLNA|nr:unnamed protein product [Cylicocyclus nassatus]